MKIYRRRTKRCRIIVTVSSPWRIISVTTLRGGTIARNDVYVVTREGNADLAIVIAARSTIDAIESVCRDTATRTISFRRSCARQFGR